MVTLFHDMMHKEVEVYVEDMITKSKISGQHIDDLHKLFERLRKYRFRLNPAKYTFGVVKGKLLGFIVNKRGIELDPDEVKAIRDMPTPKTEMENAKKPLKSQARPGVTSYSHSSNTRQTPNIVPNGVERIHGGHLGQQDDSGKEQPIYYLSKKFTECEQRYSALERMCCALV
ncbi:Retrovirus-related Pol polyprotein from transposon opus, partial [Mucuna pruriens]